MGKKKKKKARDAAARRPAAQERPTPAQGDPPMEGPSQAAAAAQSDTTQSEESVALHLAAVVARGEQEQERARRRSRERREEQRRDQEEGQEEDGESGDAQEVSDEQDRRARTSRSVGDESDDNTNPDRYESPSDEERSRNVSENESVEESSRRSDDYDSVVLEEGSADEMVEADDGDEAPSNPRTGSGAWARRGSTLAEGAKGLHDKELADVLLQLDRDERSRKASGAGNDPPQAPEDAATRRKMTYFLYISHALQTFGDRVWAFAVPILFMDLWPNTLLPVALFAFVWNLSSFILLPVVGSVVDSMPRIALARRSLIIQNSMVVVCCLFTGALAYVPMEGADSAVWNPDATTVVCFVFLLLAAIIGELAGQACNLALQKDWVVVIAAGDSAHLMRLNGTMRRIDLLSKLCGPLLFGVLVSLLPTARERVVVGVTFVGVWNILSFFPEYFTLMAVFEAYPALAHKLTDAAPDVEEVVFSAEEMTMLAHDKGDEQPEKEKTKLAKPKKKSPLRQLYQGWATYVRHEVFVTSVSYCMIYLTVLDNGALMTAWLKWHGVNEAVIGLSRGIGAIFGIIGTCLFAPILRCCNGKLQWAGMLTLGLFWLSVAPAGIQFLLGTHVGDQATSGVALSAYVLLSATVFGRLMLWPFDLAVTQIIQEKVEEDKRGLIAGVQQATTELFYVVLGIFAIILSRPVQFQYLAIVSVGVVFGACVLFSTTLCKREYSAA